MSPATVEELASRLHGFRSRYGIPGAGAAILTVDDPLLVAASGVRIRGGADPVTPDDRWHIGSCAKSMTAALVARLIQRGATRWDAPVADLFDHLGSGTHPGWRAVTMADVLTHRSGMPANPSQRELRAALTDPTPAPEQRAALAQRLLGTAPVHPGRFRYSNLGYAVAGAAIERITGKPFEAALGDEILGPLGMTTAGFGAPTGPQPWGHRPRLILAGRGPAVDPANVGPPHPSDNPPVLTPAGRLHLTLADWAAFVRLFLGPAADGLLSTSAVETITTPAPGSRQGMGWAVPADGDVRRDIALGQQGSNLRWVATAAIAADRRRASLVVCNDGRSRLLSAMWTFAAGLLR